MGRVCAGFGAALLGLVMTDIKRVLAYSTVSQLGLMMLALGVGGWLATQLRRVVRGDALDDRRTRRAAVGAALAEGAAVAGRGEDVQEAGGGRLVDRLAPLQGYGS